MQCPREVEGNGRNIDQRKADSRWLCFDGQESSGYAPVNGGAATSEQEASIVLVTINSKNTS